AAGSRRISAIRAHVNGLVYTTIQVYNSQYVGARTVVRAAPGMPHGRYRPGGLPGLEPGAPLGGAGGRRRRAEGPPAEWGPLPGCPGGRDARTAQPDAVGAGGPAVGGLGPAADRGGGAR